MVGCILSQLKPSTSALSILSCGKGHGLRPRPFPQLKMQSFSGFILYVMLILRRQGYFCYRTYNILDEYSYRLSIRVGN